MIIPIILLFCCLTLVLFVELVNLSVEYKERDELKENAEKRAFYSRFKI